VLDARTGEVAATVDLPAGADLESMVWETDRSLLTLFAHDGKVAIVRVQLKGRIERATPALDLIDDHSPYVLVEPSPSRS
jgi:hypothetical protein